jgi:multidrug efflux system outer membrane protein
LKVRALPVALAALLAACAVGRPYERPALSVPASFRGGETAPSAKSLADLEWWQIYQDKTLQQLIRTALARNRDLQIAAARVAETRALVGAARFAEAPSLQAGGGFSRSRVSKVNATPLPAGANVEQRAYDAGLSAAFEVDLWGRLARLSDAAKADLLASEYAQETVRIGLIANVATAYFDLLSLDEQLALTQRTVATREKFLELTQERFKRGAAADLDVERAQATLAAARAGVPDLQRRIAQAEDALQVLLGENPGPIVRARLELKTMPVPPQVPAGLPSTLLERRPDVREAEETLIGLNARFRAAKAALFPSITLTGSLGSQSAALRNLFTGPARVWSLGWNLVQPLLDAARNPYQSDAAAAREKQAALLYQKTVQQAFREVSDALAARDGYAQYARQQEVQVKALRSVSEQALMRYNVGYSSYFEVVDADRDLFTAETQLTQAYHDTLVAEVQLYQALGGGWDVATLGESGNGMPAGAAVAGAPGRDVPVGTPAATTRGPD